MKKLLQVNEIQIHYKSKIKNSEKPKITKSIDCFELLKNIYNIDTIEHHETFWCMYLSKMNKVNAIMKVSEGGISGTVVDVRIVLQGAINTNSTAIILSHNHPSGNMNASDADIQITNRIKEACKFFDIEVLDHIIIEPEFNSYYSFTDEGKL